MPRNFGRTAPRDCSVAELASGLGCACLSLFFLAVCWYRARFFLAPDWNHGSIQRTIFQDRGLVPMPTTYSDPGYQGCYAPYLMGWHGGLPQTGLSIQEVLQLLRGTFIIHTRAYNAKKPMAKDSNFWQLYVLFREGAEKEIAEPVPAFPLGHLNEHDQTFYDRTWAKRMSQSSDVNRYNMVEPPWYPTSKPRTRVSLQSVALETCLASKKKGGKTWMDVWGCTAGRSRTSTATSRLWTAHALTHAHMSVGLRYTCLGLS